jgi:prepilin-type N-terminal cleavage/methylation domain-containing protein
MYMSYNNDQCSQSGFTLLELAMVVLIIGLLIASIAAGSSLIKQAAIRSIITDFQNYKTAYGNFVNRYYGPPGDILRGSSYWPDTTGSSVSCGTSATYCNGNGDEIIESSNNEGRIAWRHLALAGMVNSGAPVMTASNYTTILVGSTVPTSAGTPTGGYVMAGYNSNGGMYNSSAVLSPWYNTGNQYDVGRNAVYIGAANNSAGDTNNGLSLGVLNPEDAFVIDQKIDDGLYQSSSNSFTGAATGAVRAVNDSTTTSGVNNCVVSGAYQVGNSVSNSSTKCLVGYQLN